MTPRSDRANLLQANSSVNLELEILSLEISLIVQLAMDW